MMDSIIVGVCIGAYVLWVVCRKIRRLKEGKCTCGCSGCSASGDGVCGFINRDETGTSCKN